MANGSYWHTEAEWQRVEGPLLQLDPTLSEFAESFGLQVTKNHKDWPERSIVWGESIRLHIQVYLASRRVPELLCTVAAGRQSKARSPVRS
jgi:hypothetical protein